MAIFTTWCCFHVVVSGSVPSYLPGLHVGSNNAFLMALDSKLDTRNPYMLPLSGNGREAPLMSLCPYSLMEDALLWESGLCD